MGDRHKMTKIGFTADQDKLTSEIAVRKKYTDMFSFYDILPDPDPVLKDRGHDVAAYKSMLSDSQVWACYQSRKAGVLSKEWSIDRGKAKSKNAEIIENLFKNLDIDKLVSDILEAPFFGFQPLEIIWERRDGLILPKDVIAKPPEWFGFDNDNKLVLKTKMGQPESLPERKFLCAQHNASYLNPYGEKVLSRCFWAVVFKKGGMKFWVVFTEKYGMPFIIGTSREGASEEEINDFADKLNAMVQDAVAVIPEGSNIELKEAGGKGASADIYDKLIESCDNSISKAILGQTLTTQIGEQGSYAASKTHFEVRQDIVESDKKLVEKTLNQLIRWVYELNWNTGEMPVFSMWEEEDVDKELAERDKILADTGVKFTKKYFQKNYGFDDEDIEVIDINNGSFPKQLQEFSKQTAAQGSFNDQDSIDNLINSFNDSIIQEQFKEALNPVLTMFKETGDPNLAMEKLSEIFPKMNSGELEATLANALFVSEIWGRLSGENLNAKE